LIELKNNIISCDVAKDMIPLYVDGAASEETRELVAEHLYKCKECKLYFKSVREALGINSSNRRRGRMSVGGFAGIADKIKRRRIIYKILAIILAIIALGSVLYILFKFINWEKE